jgi:hypothetical protein
MAIPFEYILTPRGTPLVKPIGYNFNKWIWQLSKEEKQSIEIMSDEDIIFWARDCMITGNMANVKITVEAVCYWARFFWDIHSSEHKRVVKIIDGAWEK